MISASTKSIFPYISAAPVVQLTTSSPSRNPTPRQHHDVAYSATLELLQSRKMPAVSGLHDGVTVIFDDSSVASQSSRKLNTLLFLATITLLVVLPGLLGMANAADTRFALGDSANTVIPVTISASSSLATATAVSTSLLLSSTSETQVTTATAATAATPANMTTIIAPSRTLFSAIITLASTSTSDRPHTSTTTSLSPPSTSLVAIGYSSYTTTIATTLTGVMSIKAGMGSTTTQRYFVFSYTAVNITLTPSNSTTGTSDISATMSIALATNAFISSSISSTTLAAENLSASTNSTITIMPPATTKDPNTSSPALPSFVTTNFTTPFAVSYVPGHATISSFIPGPAAGSSNTGSSISSNATFGLLSQNAPPPFPNGATNSVSGTIYMTVISNPSAMQLGSETQSIYPATSLFRNTVAITINGTIFTGLPTSWQVTASAASISQSTFSTSISPPRNVATTSSVVILETIAHATTWITLLTTQTVSYRSVVSSTTVGGLDLASPATVQASSVTAQTGLAGYFTSTSMATPSPMSPVSLSTSTALVASQPQVSPQYLVPNASFSGLPQPQVSLPLDLHGEESGSAVPIASALFHAASPRASTPVPTKPLLSGGTSTPVQPVTALPTDTTTPTIYEKRDISHPVSVVFVTVTSTINPGAISNVYRTMYAPWVDEVSKFKEYTYGTCSQDHYMFRSHKSKKPSTDPLSMGYNCIYAVGPTKLPPQVDFHHDEMPLPNEVRDEDTVLTITVTSFVDETYPSAVSPEDISNHRTTLLTSDEALSTSTLLLGFGFDEISIDARSIPWTTEPGFTPSLSLERRPTAATGWFTVDGKTIPPPPGFKTYHPSSEAVPTVAQDLNWSPNPFVESEEPYWTLAHPNSDATTTAPDPTAVEVSSLTANFPPSTDKPTAAAANILLDYGSSHVSAESASWEANQVTTSPTLAPRDDAISQGTGFATLSTQGVEKAVTCASSLTPVAGVAPVTMAQALADRTGVCPSGWNTISSGGEKRIKAWYVGGATNGYAVAALVIGLGVIGGRGGLGPWRM